MIFIGDTHGKTGQLANLVEGLPGEIAKFQLGDMGLGFRGVSLPKLSNFRFIRGNHDSPQLCQAHPCYAGEWGYSPEEKLFFLGGAWSIDWAMRVPGVSWWEDEELSLAQLESAVQDYLKAKPRMVATHECPTKAARPLLQDLLGPYFEAKAQCSESRTAHALQAMFDQHQPEHWVFGHYHISKDFELNGTQFHCVPELGVKELT